MKNHNLRILCGLIHLSAIIYILMIVFNALGGIGYEGIVILLLIQKGQWINILPIKDIFNQNTAQVSEKYTVYITPAGFTFSIWAVIYIFLGGAAVYCIN